uniref:Uncharacterized protein n=1 Tax=Arcella intermedia TaxID=1963864 RepID=A0A6B2LVX8_9EUKA
MRSHTPKPNFSILMNRCKGTSIRTICNPKNTTISSFNFSY